MSPPPIYLFKAARRPAHLRENLNILAAERGSIVEVAYNQMWVAPEYFMEGSIVPGTRVYFIYSDRPYSLFVPVRGGEVIAAAWEEPLLRLRVLLHSWVGIEGRGLGEFTDLVKETNRARAPGSQSAKFVLPRVDEAPLISWYDDREDEGWRRTIENLLEMSAGSEDDPYRSSVFFRPLGLRIGEELHETRRVPVAEGSEASLALRFHNPHLAEGDVGRHTLQVLASDDAVAESPGRFPLAGDLEIPFRVVGDDPELTVKIGPAPAGHTSITQRLATHGHEARVRSIPAPNGEVGRGELIGVYDLVRRLASFEPGDELTVVEAFQRLLPNEQRIAERRAALLAREGRDDEAYAILRELNPETMGDEARLLLFRLTLLRESDEGALQRVASLELTADGRFDDFLETLAGLDSPVIGRLLPMLVNDVPGDRLHDLMSRLGDRIERPDIAAEVALALYINSDDPQWAYSYLRDRGRQLRADSPKMTEALLELAAAGASIAGDDELFDDTARAITNLIAQDRVDEARSWLTRAADSLPRSEQDRLYHRIADRFIDKDRHDDAIAILVERAGKACRQGDLAEATEAVQRARGLWAATPAGRSGEPAPEWLVDEIRQVELAWEACADLVEWKKSDEARTRERLRETYLNQRILIAGGIRRQDWLEKIEEMTGAKVDWATAYRDETDDLDACAERIRNGHYSAVVHFWQKSGHEVAYRLSPACQDAEVPWLQSTSAGVRGVLEALDGG